jgi:hypothetical protein
LLPSLPRIFALIGLDIDHVMGSVGSDRSSFLADRAALALAPSLSYWSGFQKAIEGGLWYAKPANRVLQQDDAAASVPWHCSRPAHTALILMSIAHPNIPVGVHCCHRTPDNPEGYISMVVAENRLSSDIIRDGLLQHAADWPASMLHYQDARGIPELRATLSHMVQRTFMKVSSSSTRPASGNILTRCRNPLSLCPPWRVAWPHRAGCCNATALGRLMLTHIPPASLY